MRQSAKHEFAEDEFRHYISPVPYINLRITKDGTTREQKAQIVAEFTQTLERVLGKRPEHTHITIDEIDPENWGYSGMLTSEYHKLS